MTTLTCPKCNGEMRQYERNDVTVDQCTECRGLFLDRGELERLVDAESRWAQQTYAPEGPRQPSAPKNDQRHSGQRRRKHWIEDLFD